MTATEARGRFEVRWDRSMIWFGQPVPRRVTLVEATDLIQATLATVAEAVSLVSLDALASWHQELAVSLRELAQQQQKRGTTSDR